MNQEELKTLVAQMLRELAPQPEPQVKGSEYRPTVSEPKPVRQPEDSGQLLPDISEIDLREQYLVEHPVDGPAYQRLKAKTPARLGVGRAGPRYRTLSLLRFRADHAAAQDSVFSEIGPEFAQKHGLIPVKTCCESREQYLTRPDLGRRFDQENSEIIRKSLPHGAKIQLVIGDGLSSAAILANAMDCARAIGRFAGGVSRLHHAGAAGSQDEAHGRALHQLVHCLHGGRLQAAHSAPGAPGCLCRLCHNLHRPPGAFCRCRMGR